MTATIGSARPSQARRCRTELAGRSGSPLRTPAIRTEFRWEKSTAVAVKIKLKRMGKIREPYYRIVVADARTKRDGRAIEEIGKYHPKADPSLIEVNSDRAQHWLSVGAQPTDPVRKLLEVTGDWQRFKGLPGAEGTLKAAPPRSDKKEIFAAALAETLSESGATPKGKGRTGGAKAGDVKAGDGKAGDGKAGDGKADKAKPDRGERADRQAKARTASGKADTGRAGAAKAEPAKADAGKASSGKASSGKAESGKADAGKAESGKADAGKAQSGKAESGKAESGKAESGKAESGKAESGKAKAAKAESAEGASAESAAASAGQPGAGAEADAAAEPGSGD